MAATGQRGKRTSARMLWRLFGQHRLRSYIAKTFGALLYIVVGYALLRQTSTEPVHQEYADMPLRPIFTNNISDPDASGFVQTDDPTHRSRYIPERIRWSDHPVLTWDFFQGESRRHREYLAMISTGIEVRADTNYIIEQRENTSVLTVHIRSFSTDAYLMTRESWHSPEGYTPDTLEHEQIHYDLTKIYAIQLEKNMTKYVGVKKTFIGNSEESVDAQANIYIDEIMERENATVEDALSKEHDAFDRAIQHDRSAQKKWALQVKERLKSENIVSSLN